jgi:hypothetical protein
MVKRAHEQRHTQSESVRRGKYEAFASKQYADVAVRPQ